MAIFWIALGITISIWSATFPFGGLEDVGPGFFPLATGLILTVLGTILFFQSKRRKEGASPTPSKSLIHHRAAVMRVLFCLVGMSVSAAIFETLGFVLTMFLMILFMMRTIEPQKWRVALFYSLVSAVGSFVLFNVLLKTSLPHGILGF